MQKSNIRGLNAHPSRRRTVKNAPAHPTKLGRDGFHKSNPRRKAPVS